MDTIKAITRAAALTAVALTIFMIEARIPAPIPIPGIKLGLSNIVTLFALYALGPKTALAILVCRILSGGFITGQPMAILYSLSGGLAAFAFAALARFPKERIWILSALCGVIHNLGQLCAAALIIGEPGVFYYLPILTVSGIVTGVFTGIAAQSALAKLTANGLF